MERLLEYFVPEKYSLDLTVDKKKKTIGGIVKVRGQALKENIKLHAVRLKITNVLVNGDDVVQDKIDKIVNIKDIEQVKKDIEEDYNLSEQKIITNTENVMTLNDISTWTWFDLLYYY